MDICIALTTAIHDLDIFCLELTGLRGDLNSNSYGNGYFYDYDYDYGYGYGYGYG